jgi:hypothetical protein
MSAPFTDGQIYGGLSTALLLLFWGWVLLFIIRGVSRRRPGLALQAPVTLAFGLRLLVAYALNATSVATELRGQDEPGFIFHGQLLAHSSFGSSGWTDALTKKLHIWLIAIQDYLLDPPTAALRITFIALAVIGFILAAVAVYELAGPHAARLALFLIAVDPGTVFFSGLLHKEAPIYFAEGLFVYGAVLLWKRGHLLALIPMLCGCLIALSIRPYAGWFLIAAAGAILLHSTLRVGSKSPLRGLGLLAASAIVVAIAVPLFIQKSSHKELNKLQSSQTANANDKSSNLSLDEVNFSSRESVISNLPSRLRDVLLRPYPWQLSSNNQRFGFLGTLVVELLLVLLIYYLWRSRGRIMSRAGPLVYTAGFLLVAYSLSAGNAGTAYRYRTHVVVLVICLVVTLREHVLQEAVAADEQEPREQAPALSAAGAVP